MTGRTTIPCRWSVLAMSVSGPTPHVVINPNAIRRIGQQQVEPSQRRHDLTAVAVVKRYGGILIIWLHFVRLALLFRLDFHLIALYPCDHFFPSRGRFQSPFPFFTVSSSILFLGLCVLKKVPRYAPTPAGALVGVISRQSRPWGPPPGAGHQGPPTRGTALPFPSPTWACFPGTPTRP